MCQLLWLNCICDLCIRYGENRVRFVNIIPTSETSGQWLNDSSWIDWSWYVSDVIALLNEVVDHSWLNELNETFPLVTELIRLTDWNYGDSWLIIVTHGHWCFAIMFYHDRRLMFDNNGQWWLALTHKLIDVCQVRFGAGLWRWWYGMLLPPISNRAGPRCATNCRGTYRGVTMALLAAEQLSRQPLKAVDRFRGCVEAGSARKFERLRSRPTCWPSETR